MDIQTKTILNKAMNLSASSRALIAHDLLDSLESPDDHNSLEDWMLLAEKRIEELESGKVKGVSWDAIRENVEK